MPCAMLLAFIKAGFVPGGVEPSQHGLGDVGGVNALKPRKRKKIPTLMPHLCQEEIADGKMKAC